MKAVIENDVRTANITVFAIPRAAEEKPENKESKINCGKRKRYLGQPFLYSMNGLALLRNTIISDRHQQRKG